VHCVTYSEVLATLSTTGSENATTVLGGHTGTETMLVETAMVVWLECHLHSCNSFILFLIVCLFSGLYCQIAGAKVGKNIQFTKLFNDFLQIFLFFSMFFSIFAPARWQNSVIYVHHLLPTCTHLTIQIIT
jgi:hypothetical protein